MNIISPQIMSSRNAAAPTAQKSTKSCDELIPSSKMTAVMSASLETLRSSLLCGLCNQMMKDAATLGCAHSFCYDCISKYTEHKWNCPFPSCNQSVTSMKGNSSSYIKKNPQINDVVIALKRIEENVRVAPDNWWEDGDSEDTAADDENDGGNKNQEEEEEEIVDFAAMQQNDNNSDDESSTTKAYEPEGKKKKCDKMNEMSIEQSLFPSDQSADAKVDSNASLPRFSGVSTIAWQHSQMTEESKKSKESTTPLDSVGPQTATASQLDRALMLDSGQQDPSKAAASYLGVEVKSSITKHAPNQPEKKKTPNSEKKRKNSNTPTAEPTPKSRRTFRVSFQPLPKVMLLKPSLALKNTESRSIRKCIKDDMISMLKMPRDDVMEDDNLDTGFDFDTEGGREHFLSLLSSKKDDDSTAVPLSHYALSTEREYAFEEGVVVPRSFQFYLAVACGLSIVDISFLDSHSKKKRLGIMNHQRYLIPSIDVNSITQEEKATHVIGASNHNWFAPQKARSAAIERHSLWTKDEGIHASSDTLLPGTDLLQNYSVVLVGDFDQPSVSKRVAKKKVKSTEATSDGSRTRGNISILLQLCGAKIYDVTSIATSKQIKKGLNKTQIADVTHASPLGHSQHSHESPTLKDALQDDNDRELIVMVKDKSDTNLGTDFLVQYESFASESKKSGSIDVVSCDWLFDCIGDFQVHKSR